MILIDYMMIAFSADSVFSAVKYSGFPTGFYGDMVLCQEPHELPSEGFATTF